MLLPKRRTSIIPHQVRNLGNTGRCVAKQRRLGTVIPPAREKATLSKHFTHRNHYIPQRYQLGFANDAGKVWLFDRKTLHYRDGAPINIGVQRDFYTTVDSSGVPNDLVEKMLASLEAAVWPVLDRLGRRVDEINAEDREHLALFVALMRTRTPAFDQMSDNVGNTLFRWFVKAHNPTPEMVVEDYKKYAGETIDPSKAQYIFDAIQSNKYFVEIPRQNKIKIMLNTALELGQAIVTMGWTIYWTTPDSTFVTSDNPFIVVPPLCVDTNVEATGPLSHGATNLIPLSSTTLLCARQDSSGPIKFVRANRDFVRTTNQRIASASNRFLLARDEALLRKLVKVTRADQGQNNLMPTIVSPSSNQP